MLVKISTSWFKKKFLCSYDYILQSCHGRCCQGSGKILISLLPEEEERFKTQYPIENHLLCADKRGICPHKNNNGLCNLHNTQNKPFGCIASPFTLNKNNTLIIRYRYSRLKCFGEGDYAYKVFKPSLDLILGKVQSDLICKKLDDNEEKITAEIPEETVGKLKYLDNLK